MRPKLASVFPVTGQQRSVRSVLLVPQRLLLRPMWGQSPEAGYHFSAIQLAAKAIPIFPKVGGGFGIGLLRLEPVELVAGD